MTDVVRVSPGWLALRGRADDAARSVVLAELLRAHLSPGPVGSVWDLGCGTGALARWLAPRLPGPPPWVLLDRDPDLLALATLPPDVPVHRVTGDLTGLRAADLAGAAAVTASALLDLLTATEVDDLAAACTGIPALFGLTVTGTAVLDPGDPLDAAVTAAFNAHQRRETGGRRLLGPDAVAAATASFRRRGNTVHTRPSPWRLDTARPADAALAAEWLRGWTAAAAEQDPALPTAPYLASRLSQLATGTLRITLHHTDLLALPNPQ